MMGPRERSLFQAMYDEYKVRLRRIAIRFRIPYDELDDIVQETFVSYMESYEAETKNKGPVLVRILKNKCIDYYRKKWHEQNISADSEEGKIALDMLMSGLGEETVNEIAKKELYRKVRQCIAEMRSDWRDVIIYCCLFRYSSEKAGKILGISATACRSRLMRAREYINKTLGDEFREYFG